MYQQFQYSRQTYIKKSFIRNSLLNLLSSYLSSFNLFCDLSEILFPRQLQEMFHYGLFKIFDNEQFLSQKNWKNILR